MATFKVIGGTTNTQDLCRTCRSSHIYTDSLGEHKICTTSVIDTSIVIRGAVTTCNEYSDKSTPRLHQLKEIAWIVNADKKGQIIGFLPPPEDS